MVSAEEVSCRREHAGDGVWEDEIAIGGGRQPIPRPHQLFKEPLIAARPLVRQERRSKENRVSLAIDTCNENKGHPKAIRAKGAIEGDAVVVEHVVSALLRSHPDRMPKTPCAVELQSEVEVGIVHGLGLRRENKSPAKASRKAFL